MAIKIAVIDTGVSFDLLAEDIFLKKYISMKQKEDRKQHCIIEISEGIDYGNIIEASHGTKVVNTIKKYATNAEVEFYLYDVFSNNKTSSGAIIIEALNDILNYDVDIIMMSLTCSSKYKWEFMQMRDTILEKKIIYVCSASNTGNNHFPANLDFIFGVTGEHKENGKFNYYPYKEIQFCSSTQYEFIGNSNKLQIFGGTSKAAAVVVGMLANYASQKGIDSLQHYLEYEHIMPECKKKSNDTEEYSEVIFEEVLESFGLQNFNMTYELLHKTIPWNKKNIERLLNLFEKFHATNKIQKLNYSEFESLYALIRYFENFSKGK